MSMKRSATVNMMLAEVVAILLLNVQGYRDGDIRLSGSDCKDRGRLEVYYGGSWGTVCDDGFTAQNAEVVCKQLGLSYRRKAKFYTIGDGTGPIWLDNVKCTGIEISIGNCRHDGWGTHNCGHHEDIGIACIKVKAGDLKLVGASTIGRLEIYYDHTWRSICYENFNQTNAEVACHQLEIGTDNVEVFDTNTTDIESWLNNIECTGNETFLHVCPHDDWDSYQCSPVGIKCSGTYKRRKGDLQLVGTSRNMNLNSKGRLEVFYSGNWGTVCDDHFDINDARVVCKQLGFGTGGAATYDPGDGPTTKQTYLDDLKCFGTEQRLQECTHNGWGKHNCGHSEDIGVVCCNQSQTVVDGDWNIWSNWGNCSVTCGLGFQSRMRKCNDPTPSADGLYCFGSSSEIQTCEIVSCPTNDNTSTKNNIGSPWFVPFVVICIGLTLFLSASLIMVAVIIRRRLKGPGKAVSKSMTICTSQLDASTESREQNQYVDNITVNDSHHYSKTCYPESSAIYVNDSYSNDTTKEEDKYEPVLLEGARGDGRPRRAISMKTIQFEF